MSLALHPLERAILRSFFTREDREAYLTLPDIAHHSGLEPAQVQMGVEWLKAKAILVERVDRLETVLSLTEGGEEALASGLPEERILDALAGAPREMNGLRELFSDPSIVSKAVGALKDSGTIRIGVE